MDNYSISPVFKFASEKIFGFKSWLTRKKPGLYPNSACEFHTPNSIARGNMGKRSRFRVHCAFGMLNYNYQ
jgi:hypothetical protein